MIILYGSYARNEYVDFDEREEFGITYSFRIDYNIWVVTNGISDKSAGQILDNVEMDYFILHNHKVMGSIPCLATTK